MVHTKLNYFEPELECATRDKIKKIQLTKLNKMLHYCYENVRFYKNLLDENNMHKEINSLDDLSKLPFTTKKDLENHYPFGLVAVPIEEISEVHASSGTTGKRKIVGYTDEDIELCSKNLARMYVAFGANKDDLLINTFLYGLFSGGLGIHHGANKLGMGVIPFSAGSDNVLIDLIRDLQPTIISGTPSYILHIGSLMRKHNLKKDDISLKYGILGAEPWSESAKPLLMNSLGIKAYDLYGLSELMICVSFECSAESGLHINEDRYIPEIVDPVTGDPLPYGEKGELVITTLDNRAMPLIRYRTGDISSIYLDKCPCGRTLIKMSKPHGRTDDMLIIKGVNVFPSQIEDCLLKLGFVSNYQILIKTRDYLDVFEILVEVLDFFSLSKQTLKERKELIGKMLKDSLGISAEVNIVSEGTIPNSSGKAKRIIDNRL